METITTEFKTTIYKKDSKGKIRELTIESHLGKLTQTSGVVGGKLKAAISHSKAKNVGKKNETTPAQQAIREAVSKATAKLKVGYFNTIHEAETIPVYLPMLALDFKTLEAGAFHQNKLDGMRGLAIEDSYLKTREGNRVATVDHLNDELNHVRQLINMPDGELYNLAIGTFQEQMSAIKKYRPGITERVHFNVYDFVSPLPYIDRLKVLEDLFAKHQFEFIKPVETTLIEDMSHLKLLHAKSLSDGFEGSIIRQGDSGYICDSRSGGTFKYKDFLDMAVTVIDVVPSDKRPTHGKVRCELNAEMWYTLNGEGRVTKTSPVTFPKAIFGHPPFTCNMKFPHTKREEILRNKEDYIGLTAEIRFFEYTDGKLPRFPVCHGFRLDK